MELYIKQRVFTWGDRFSVYDALEREQFYVEGEVFSFGKKLHLYDLNGQELAYIQQKVWSFCRSSIFFATEAKSLKWCARSRCFSSGTQFTAWAGKWKAIFQGMNTP